MSVIPVIEGLAATAVAALIFLVWLAVGSLIADPGRSHNEIAVPASLLAGNAFVAFVLALFCAAGLVRSGVAVTAMMGLATVFLRRKSVASILREIGEPLARLVRDPLGLSASIVFGISLWATAIAPPRNADAMRYHLAHIRQIASDGAWTRIADVHYALPFGWSLSFMPFELLHLPQGAQVLSLGLFVVFISCALRMAAPYGRESILAASLLFLHPAMLRAFSEPTADAYAIFVMLGILIALRTLCSANQREAALAGFIVWIGAQSRYQLVGAAIAGSICAAVILWRLREQRRLIPAFAAGAIAAAVLASPFYIANAIWFSDPVWPLLIDAKRAALSYPNAVAYSFRLPLEGGHTLSSLSYGIARLVTTPFFVPLPFVVAFALVSGILLRRGGSRIAGWFGITFLIAWALMQPYLYPRFILLFVPLAFACVVILASRLSQRSAAARSALWRGSLAAAGVLAVAAPALAFDDFHYVATGDAEEFHRFTWFYDAYQWINRETPRDARFLVIVTSGMTYYLDRPYRRADPWLSGEVDWPATSNGAALTALLDREGFRYVLIEDQPGWSDFPGGTEMQRAISEAVASGGLSQVRSFDETLYASRARRKVLKRSRLVLLERINR